MTARRMTLRERCDALLGVARDLAAEYEMLCESMRDAYGCEGCPLNVEDMEGGACAFYGRLYPRLCDLGVLGDG